MGVVFSVKIVSGLSCGNILPQKSIGLFTELEDTTNLTVLYINLSAGEGGDGVPES